MARGVNKVILIGNLGKEPELRHMGSGGAVVSFSIATSETWKDKNTGQAQERTEWHLVVFYGKLAEIIAQYAKKGTKIYVEGKLRTRKWQNKQGQDQYTTEVVGNEMELLGSRPAGAGSSQPDQGTQHPAPAGQFDGGDFDDDIPF